MPLIILLLLLKRKVTFIYRQIQVKAGRVNKYKHHTAYGQGM